MPVFVPIVMQLGRVVLQAGSRSVFNFLKKQGFKQIAKSSKKAKNAPTVTKLNQAKKFQKPKVQTTKPKVQAQTKPKPKPKSKTQTKKKPQDKKQGNILTRNKGKAITALTIGTALGVGQLTGPEEVKSMPKKKDVVTTDKKAETKPLTSVKKKETPLKKLKEMNVKTVKTKALQEKKKVADKPKRTNITAGGNVGFGLKGNIFASNDDDRKRLMAKFGGTGSAAARAAMKGTQGNIVKSKSKKGHTDMRKGGLFYG
tara:strand:- start:367 stop:1137 length:771 start_codon:yes stop_codon:yes gene_type:complete